MSYVPYPEYYLDLPSDSIRLLRLLPNEDKRAPIQSKLFTYSLRDWGKRTHPYDALSYVWGSWDNPQSISISEQNFENEHVLPVTRNLHEALSRLRHRSIDRILWIDAICINQKNDREKEQQIQFMAKIYAQADRVVVWLGETADGSDRALEEMRVAGGKKSTDSFNSEAIPQAVVALLQRPWFQRIWVLQEAAAARHVLIMCGSAEIDGYAFCLGVDSFLDSYKLRADLQSVARSVTYLIRGAIFRPKYSMGRLSRSTLDISSLDELMDMYHARQATMRHDKVYALLGMSSDDLSNAGLSPSYEVPWEDLFQRLVKYLLCQKISVETWCQTEIAVVRSKGCVLGKVSSVQSNIGSEDRQGVDVMFMNIWGQPKNTEVQSEHWNLHASAKSIQNGDIICLLQGTSKPLIIRLCKDHFDVVMIAFSPPEKIPVGDGYIEWPKLLQSETIFTRDFMLVWDWNISHPKEYEALIQTSKVAYSGHMDRHIEDHLDDATSTWNYSLILGDLEEYQKAEEKLREAIEGYKVVFEERPHTRNSEYDLTPLLWASKNGHEAMVKLLLEKYGVDPDLKDSQYGLTPLSRAAENGYEPVIKLLLETGKANVNSKDTDSRTPLSRAAENGHEPVVRLLLETGKADVNSKDTDGRTPLWWATKNGHEAVVELLLKTGKAEANSKNIHHPTPLSRAAENGYELVVKLLLEAGKADVNSKDIESRTPLLRAAENGHESVVRLLLETGEADVNSKDTEGRAPLSRAAENGHEPVVKLLLGTSKANVNSQDNKSRTPLSWAAKNGHKAVVKLLLETGEAYVNSKDQVGRTPLQWAAEGGHEAVVQLLLKTGEAEINSRKGTQTPLSFAAKNGHKAVVELLLETGKADINLTDYYSRTPLQWAAEGGHEAIVELLLKTGKSEVDLKDRSGQTSLSTAAANGHDAVAKLLLEGKADVNSKDEDRGTPLSWAARNGHEAVVRLLLKAKAEVNSKDDSGQTPLSWAAKNKHEAVVKLLQSAPSHQRRTFLGW